MLVLFSGMCIIENDAVRSRPAEPQLSGRASSIYMLAGEFRTVFANLLWIKAEQYHHEFLLRNGDWTKNRELMGLIDLITALDPHFVEAYETGTYILNYGCGNHKKALKYVLQAIANNPHAWDLHRIAAIIYARQFHNPERAIEHMRMAVKYCDNDFDRGLARKLLRTIIAMQKEQRSGTKQSPKPD